MTKPTPDQIITMRYSELKSLAGCAYRHRLEYAHRIKPAKLNENMARGSALHAMFEGHYRSFQMDDTAGAPRSLERAYEAAWSYFYKYKEGEGSGAVTPEIQDLCAWMYEGYTECYGTDQAWSQILIVEDTRIVPLVTLEHEGRLIEIRLKATADLVVRRRIDGKLALVDHKTHKGRDVSKDEFAQEGQLDPQRGIYVASFRDYGDEGGRLPIFMASHNAIRADRLKRKMTVEERYRRHSVFFSQNELGDQWAEAQEMALEAARIRLGGAVRYSNADSQVCRMCAFKQVHMAARTSKRDPVEVALNYSGAFKQVTEQESTGA